MITLHRLGHAVDTFQINPDAITTIEATPDTVITILNGQKIVVAEPPHRVAELIATYRATVLAEALILRHELRAERNELRRVTPLRKPSTLTAVHDAAVEARPAPPTPAPSVTRRPLTAAASRSSASPRRPTRDFAFRPLDFSAPLSI
jgi:flagellar protein FlbD